MRVTSGVTFAPSSASTQLQYSILSLQPTINGPLSGASRDLAILKIAPVMTAWAGANKYLIQAGTSASPSLFTVDSTGDVAVTGTSTLTGIVGIGTSPDGNNYVLLNPTWGPAGNPTLLTVQGTTTLGSTKEGVGAWIKPNFITGTGGALDYIDSLRVTSPNITDTGDDLSRAAAIEIVYSAQGAATNNYSIYSSGGPNHFGGTLAVTGTSTLTGNVGIGAAPTSGQTLKVVGGSGESALQLQQNDSGQIALDIDPTAAFRALYIRGTSAVSNILGELNIGSTGASAGAGGLHVTGTIIGASTLTLAGKIHSTSPASQTLEHFTLQQASVAHGITSWTATDNYFRIRPNDAAEGGAYLWGFAEGSRPALTLRGSNATATTTKSTAATAPLELTGDIKNGSTTGAHSGTQNVIAMTDYSTTLWILGADGGTWQNGGITALGNLMLGTTSNTKGIALMKNGGGASIGIDLHNLGTNAADDVQINFETQGQIEWACGIDRTTGDWVLGRHGTLGNNLAIRCTNATTPRTTISGVTTFPNNVTCEADLYMTGNRAYFIDSDGGGTPSLDGETVVLVQNNGVNGQGCALTLISGAGGVGTINFGDNTDEDRGSFEYSQDTENFTWRGAGSGTALMTLKGVGGKVGIGTTSPGSALHIQGSSSQTLHLESTGDDQGILSLDGDRAGADSVCGQIRWLWNNTRVAQIAGHTGADTTNKDDGELGFYTAASSVAGAEERMRIDSAGNVGIGTSSPSGQFHAYQNTSSECNWYFDNQGSGTGQLNIKGGGQGHYHTIARTSTAGIAYVDGHWQVKTHNGTSWNQYGGLYQKSDGRVGIGTTSPIANFVVADSKSGTTDPTNNIIQILQNTDATSNNYASLMWKDAQGNDASAVVCRYVNHTNNESELSFWTRVSSGNVTQAMTIDSSQNITMSGTLAVTGALSKGSGNFKIDHPLPAKTDTHHLVHSFIEGPRADLIYRGVADLSGGSATVDLDEAAGMSAGTWELLCRDPQVWMQNDSGWGAVRGSVEGNTLTIECEETSSSDTVSWMVVAERCDPHITETGWTDDAGRVIVEPEKEEEE
jgi:hypothetical protein